MGYTHPPRAKEHILQGVRIISDEPYMREDSEVRYVYGKPYYNYLTHEIEIW